MTYQLYIGANNETGQVERPLIERVLNKYFDGYTIVPTTGYWLGKREKSVQVILATDKDSQTVNKCLYELKKVLKQDAIAFQLVPSLNFI
jgi:hypothetical protein